jgi:hypothetical protein
VNVGPIFKGVGIGPSWRVMTQSLYVLLERLTKIEKNMLRWFCHVERMDERRLTKEIYEADVGGNAGRGRPRQTFLDQIGEVLEKVRSRVLKTGECV